MKKLHSALISSLPIYRELHAFRAIAGSQKSLLRGISVAMYIVGQERRLVDPPSQVVAGVRTVTTKMDERCDAHVAALIRFFGARIRTK